MTTFPLFLLVALLTASLLYLTITIIRLREKEKTINSLTRKMFELRKNSRNPRASPSASPRHVDRIMWPAEMEKEREKFKEQIEKMEGELSSLRDITQKFQKCLWPEAFRGSSEAKSVRERLQEALLQEKEESGANELFARIYEVCTQDEDSQLDAAVKSGTAIYNWLNSSRLRKKEKANLLKSYTNWLNMRLETFRIYSAIVQEGDQFTENLHDADGYGSRIRKVHSFIFYYKNSGVYKKARVTI